MKYLLTFSLLCSFAFAQMPRDFITYEIFVHAFADGNGDGIGDFKGLTKRLDYVADLGVDAIWLMPIHPAPSYHKYDISHYREIHPDYGNMKDFERFLAEAHKRDLKVFLDVVFNHSSSEHPWFQEAIASPKNPYRDYYVWSNEEELMKEHPHHWHAVEDAAYAEKYYGFFWHGMPDLNLSNPKVRKELQDIGAFWLEKGVDGFRMDAARHFFPDDDSKQNVDFLAEFRAAMEKIKPDVLIVSEVWGEAEVIAPYLKGSHAIFNFDLGKGITKILQQENDSLNLLKRQQQIQALYAEVTDDYVDAIFLSNHDQNRIRSEIDDHLPKAKLAASILLTLPGSPFIYYGEELGMLGKKPDEQIREPMLWGNRGEYPEQTRWVEAQYSLPPKVMPVSQQQADSNSIYHHYKTLIQLRKQQKALSSGAIKPFEQPSEEVLAYERVYKNERVLVIHNLSMSPQRIELTEDWQTDLYMRTAAKEGREVRLGAWGTVVLGR